MICPIKKKRDKDIDYAIKKLFSNGHLIKENLNFSILLATDLMTLYKEKGIKNLIKEEEKDFDSFSSFSRQSMIENLSNVSFSSDFESIDEVYTYTNLFDIIENNGKLMKKEIEETKKNEPEKYIEINECLLNPRNSDLYISGILAKNISIMKELMLQLKEKLQSLLKIQL